MFSFINRLYGRRYLNSLIVLGIDIVASSFASFLTLLMTKVVERYNIVSVHTACFWLGGALVFSWLSFYVFRTHKSIIRHTTLRSLSNIGMAVLCKELAQFVLLWLVIQKVTFSRIIAISIIDLLFTFSILVAIRMVMVIVYNYTREQNGNAPSKARILIYGTGENSVAMLTRLVTSSKYCVVGFISSNQTAKKLTISGKRVFFFKTSHDVAKIKDKIGVQAVLFVTDENVRKEQMRLVSFCTGNGIRVLVLPSAEEVQGGKIKKPSIREIKIEDLLGRDEITINLKEIKNSFAGKVIMVTGAAGSIGSELCRQLADLGVRQLVLFDNAESPMHALRLELEERFPNLNFASVIGDVRLVSRLDYAFRRWRPQVVFHAAAYKHVPLMEENPCEAVLVNVMGSRNVADKCVEYNVEKMVMVSTDKAVNPTNIMGCTKRLAEIYVQSLGLAIQQGTYPIKDVKTRFVTTRFGNVLGSNGSVIPRFREQIAKGGPVTVTHPEITRFFMTIPEACHLVMEAATMSTGNQIFVFDMGRSMKIADLAYRMIELAGLVPGKDIEVAFTGLRPGEKLYEEVLSNAENTIPTDHDRILIAKVREYDYSDALQTVEQLEDLSRKVEIPDMVRLMKKTVPEFKSKNSEYEKYDKEIEASSI